VRNTRLAPQPQRDDHGRLEAVPRKDTVKTAAGFRVLVVPEHLMVALRTAVEAFHTDPDTGTVEVNARLVPGIRAANQAGLMNYQTSLADAAAAEGLSSADLGFRVTTHLLRKSAATDLAWATGIDDTSGAASWDTGPAMTSTAGYTPSTTPTWPRSARSPRSSTPTSKTRSAAWSSPPPARSAGAGQPLRSRVDHVDATLAAAGWQVEPGAPDDPLCAAERVAAELDIYVTTARRWVADGTLPTVVGPDDCGVPRRWVRLSDVWGHRDRLAGRLLLPDVAESLGLRYHEAYHLLRRLDLDLEQHPTTGEYELTSEAVGAMRAETERIRALHRRSVKLAAAGRQLRMAASSVALMSRMGELEVDPETDSSGARFVTRASVQRAWMARQERRKPRTAQAVPVAEVARSTGHTGAELVDLVKAGVLQSNRCPAVVSCCSRPPACGPGWPRAAQATPSRERWLEAQLPDKPRCSPAEPTLLSSESGGTQALAFKGERAGFRGGLRDPATDATGPDARPPPDRRDEQGRLRLLGARQSPGPRHRLQRGRGP
jgi:hypothetical protein